MGSGPTALSRPTSFYPSGMLHDSDLLLMTSLLSTAEACSSPSALFRGRCHADGEVMRAKLVSDCMDVAATFSSSPRSSRDRACVPVCACCLRSTLALLECLQPMRKVMERHTA